MKLYRAIYQRTPQHGSTLRGLTFVARDALAADTVARDWQLPSDRLLTVRAVRPVQVTLNLTGD